MKRLAIGILAHVDAGKTTLSEAMLYHTGEIRRMGRVDHGDAFLDTDQIEKSRGITIFSKQAMLEFPDMSVALLDTPGHVDFSAEMERTLSVLDYAVLVISASDGVQSHTETLWKLLRRYQIPTFLFVNKMDLAIHKRGEILKRIEARLPGGFCDFGETDEESFWEAVSLHSERLTEQLLERGHLSDEDIAGAVAAREVVPVYFGAALKDQGVEALLEGLRRFTKPCSQMQAFGARVFKISRDDRGERLVFVKLTGGTLAVKDEIGEEKINQIRIYSGLKYKTVEEAEAGMVCALTGLTAVSCGDGLGAEVDAPPEVLEPYMTYRVLLPEEIAAHRALENFRQLSEEDPKLHVRWNEAGGCIELQLMGRVQLEILSRIVQERFGYSVAFGEGRILYKETLDPAAGTVEGIGHFEPLKHYAEVHLLLTPGERDSGLVFSTCVSEDDLDRNWQRLILTHLEEREHPGVLTGAPITDMKITLASGRAHKKHTEGGDFRQATYRAIRCGLMRGQNILLEPWFAFRIEVPSEQVGRVMADVQKMKGTFQTPETLGESTLLLGRAPASELMDYPVEIASFTGGRGHISFQMDGYDRCHNEEEVLAETGYDPQRDIENPADSVFCDHGSGDLVSWKEIEEYMHLPLALSERGEYDPSEDSSLKNRATRYVEEMVSDAELMKIFERTYGPVRSGLESGRKKRTNPGRQGFVPPRDWTAPRRKNAPKSGRTFVLIDGYNLIHAWEELDDLSQRDFGAARDKLVDILCNYRGFTEYEVIVVFDAYKVKGGVGSQERIRNVDVVYTREAETADMYIEKVTHEIARKHDVRVVTSDGLEQLIILGHGALRISSREFIEEVHRIEDAIRECVKRDGSF